MALSVVPISVGQDYVHFLNQYNGSTTHDVDYVVSEDITDGANPTTFQDGDILVLLLTGEQASGNFPNNASGGGFPTLFVGPQIQYNSTGNFVSDGWVDLGYRAFGNQTSAPNIFVGAYSIVLKSTNTLQNMTIRMRYGTGLQTNGNRAIAHTVVVIRGAVTSDFENTTSPHTYSPTLNGSLISKSSGADVADDTGDLDWFAPSSSLFASTGAGIYTSTETVMKLLHGAVRTSTGMSALDSSGFNIISHTNANATQLAGTQSPSNTAITTTLPGLWEQDTATTSFAGNYSTGGNAPHDRIFYINTDTFSNVEAGYPYAFRMVGRGGGHNDHNSGASLSVIFREAATATNTPLPLTEEATSLDTFDLVVSRSIEFTDEATGLETKVSVVGLGLLEKADALETKDQTKVKNLPLTDEATGLDTKADNFGYAVPFTDEAASLDTAQKGVAEVFADEATGLEAFDKTISSLIADSAEAVETSLKSISDSLLESADAVETKDENFGYAEFFTDVAEALDSFGKAQGLGLLEEATADSDLDLPEKRFTDEATAVETFTTTRIYSLEITDSVTTVGDPDPQTEETTDNTRGFTDESTAVDTFVVTRVFDFPITDSSTTVDVDVYDITRAFTLEVTDSASPVETKEEAFALTLGFTDESTSVESATKQFGTLFTDVADALDEPAFDFGFSVEFTDEAAGLDTAVIPAPEAIRNFTESTSAAESLASGVKIGLSLDIICEGILEGKSPPQLLTKEEALAIIDVYNIALNALGVGTLSGVNDGSPQATILNDTFDSFKRQFLTDYSWNGAKKTVALSRLQDYNSTDVKPVGDRWAYAYVLPDDYLRVLRINGYERYNNTQQHLENAFEIEVVNYATSATETANKRCLLTEEPSVNLEYIFEPTDDDLTTLLGSQTEHALGLSFAHYIARNFGKTPQEIAVLADEARRAITAAKGVDGQEKTQRLRPDLGLIESRYWWRG